MSKAYDHINIFMMCHALNRLKLPISFINFITNLFTNRSNQIFTPFRLTDKYDVLVEIDQGKVICPLLWCIYYNPLLSYIQQKPLLGYHLSHQWTSDINLPSSHSLKETIPDTAFIDDITWLSSSFNTLEFTINIADSFYKLNDILINDDKAILLTNKPLSESRKVYFTINGRQISLVAKPVNHSE